MALKSKAGIMNVTLGTKIRIIRSKRVITGNTVSSCDIIISDGKISSILPWGKQQQQVTSGAQLLDVGDLVVMAGIIDPHVHVNEPGRTDWEGYRTATLAAAAGGITAIVDMPLNSLPPTTSVSNFHTKLQAAKGQCYVDVAFWGGVIPNNQVELIPLLQAGVAGFKCFLINSGVPEFPHVSVMDLHAAMTELQGTNSVLLVSGNNSWLPPLAENGDPTLYETFLDSRPDNMEVAAVELVADLCLQYNLIVRCHIVHLSSAQSLTIIRKAKEAGAPLTVETTHHYLSLSSEHIPPGATYYKCCPPVRGHHNKEALWNALLQGHIDMVVSDHSPCTPDLKLLKEGDYMKAWGGISSLQFGLSLFWTSARTRGFSLTDVSHLLSSNTAKLCGLDNRKGSIKVGYDADLVIWDPDREFQVKEKDIYHKNKLTPYLGFLLQGEVMATLVRGTLVYYKGKHAAKPTGELVNIHSAEPAKPGAPYY
ncbi:PREDICTED: allantoinase, mitochondrial-like [Nanorana parkeri]|uniref:allantoinase, mitochondrial-like n=1 Tax=Nanorana parkeri TaxID=125878 RepID=UPI000854DB4D|nr:PREDICTED: allantoinase, mitochondrial-like [Nanorana parkeri]